MNGNPDPVTEVPTAPDAERITILTPKTVIPIAELPSGQSYSFYPVTVGSNNPLANPRLTETGGFVAVRGLTPQANRVYDFFATGDTLLNAHASNLQVGYTETPLSLDSWTGCTVIPGNAAYPPAEQFPVATGINNVTVQRINDVTIATLAMAAISLPLIVISALALFAQRRRAAEPAQAAVGAKAPVAV